MTTAPYDDTLLGVVTTAPGLRLGSDETGANQGKQPIALAGRVPVKVSLENGTIKKGDYLTSSSKNGFAMKALDAGRVIGIALEDYTLQMDEENNHAGKVLVFVNPHTYMGVSFIKKVGSTLSKMATLFQSTLHEFGITLTDEGNIGVGTTTPTAQLTTVGTVRFSALGAGTLQTDARGNLTVQGDSGLMTIDTAYTRGMDALRGIEPIQYHWNEASGFDREMLYTGFSAQNIQEFIPEAVNTDSNGFLTLSDRPLLATVINATKEQQIILDELITASSTVLSIKEGDTFWSRLTTLIANFVDGVLSVAGLNIGSPDQASGITVFDTETGEPYCMFIANGQTRSEKGDCASVLHQPDTNETTIQQEPNSVPETVSASSTVSDIPIITEESAINVEEIVVTEETLLPTTEVVVVEEIVTEPTPIIVEEQQLPINETIQNVEQSEPVNTTEPAVEVIPSV